jgi:hypothetical protein
MHKLLKSCGVELTVGGGQESVESLAIRCYYPEDNLRQRPLNLIAEPVNGV